MVVGLDNCGKSTLLCALPEVSSRIAKAAKHNGLTVASTLPTPGMQLVQLSMAKRRSDDQSLLKRLFGRQSTVRWQIWDLSGQGKHRPLWSYYSSQVHAIVFVVDLTDPGKGDGDGTLRLTSVDPTPSFTSHHHNTPCRPPRPLSPHPFVLQHASRSLETSW